MYVIEISGNIDQTYRGVENNSYSIGLFRSNVLILQWTAAT